MTIVDYVVVNILPPGPLKVVMNLTPEQRRMFYAEECYFTENHYRNNLDESFFRDVFLTGCVKHCSRICRDRNHFYRHGDVTPYISHRHICLTVGRLKQFAKRHKEMTNYLYQLNNHLFQREVTDTLRSLNRMDQEVVSAGFFSNIREEVRRWCRGYKECRVLVADFVDLYGEYKNEVYEDLLCALLYKLQTSFSLFMVPRRPTSPEKQSRWKYFLDRQLEVSHVNVLVVGPNFDESTGLKELYDVVTGHMLQSISPLIVVTLGDDEDRQENYKKLSPICHKLTDLEELGMQQMLRILKTIENCYAYSRNWVRNIESNIVFDKEEERTPPSLERPCSSSSLASSYDSSIDSEFLLINFSP